MPYRGDFPAFSFSGIHTACISGDNGAGKSSIIDAITWALWGKTRASSDDELISIGTEETAVEFDFMASGSTYRVIRKRTRAKKITSSGQSSLDLLLSTQEGFKPLTADTISKTQAEINRLLHMDYDTFVNSAYLRQGHADEFSRQTPSRRKDVLASILKLDIYDTLAESARQKTREKQIEGQALEHAIKEIRVELENKDLLTRECEKAGIEMDAAEKEFVQAQSQHERLNRLVQTMENQQDQLERAKSTVQELQAQIASWQKQAEQSRIKIAGYENILAEGQAIEDGFSRYLQAKDTFDEMSRRLRLLNQTSEQKNRLEKIIESERNKLLNQQSVASKTLNELENKASLGEKLKNNIVNQQAASRKLSEREISLQQAEEKTRNIQEQIQNLEYQDFQSNQRVHEIDSRLELISREPETNCPLCEKPLEENERLLILKKYSQEKTALTRSLEANAYKIAELRKTLEQDRQSLLAARKILRLDLEKHNNDTAILNHRINECEQAGKQVEAQKAELESIEKRLEEKSYAQREQAELANIYQQLQSLEYNEQAYNQSRADLDRFEYFKEQKLKLSEASTQIQSERETAEAAIEAIDKLTLRQQADQEIIVQLTGKVADLPSVKKELVQAEENRKTADNRLKAARETVYRLQARLESLKDQESKLKKKEADLKKTALEEATYKTLTQAFGKKGIQGMLIEMAIPEIENEANRILGKMTDNRMALKIESQKLKKTGEKAETLEINISDEVGTRNYEMYSGGEAFRIDFALRIALAKLLANRSGAPLPTLIIDEGFGTQDDIGLEKVKEAINSIQNDFEIILVITHIDELKNAFNSRIEVTKTPEGSVVDII
ncbi:MAG: SMC family ATPase [Dehalococcoidaceae bacterium]|nr:SMC family ATPase [Dehalococcoidaceae bacterium]